MVSLLRYLAIKKAAAFLLRGGLKLEPCGGAVHMSNRQERDPLRLRLAAGLQSGGRLDRRLMHRRPSSALRVP